MPDIQMCTGLGCSVARNCYRSPKSGTVPTDIRQSWINPPGHNQDCMIYWAMLETSEKTCSDVNKALWRLVEYFVRYRQSESFKQQTDDGMWDYLSSSLTLTIDNDDAPQAQALLEWLAEGPGAASAYEQINNLVLAVASCIDTYQGFDTYSTLAWALLDKEKATSAAVMVAGNGSVN